MIQVMSPTKKDEGWSDDVMSVWRGWVNAREYYDRRLRREIENWRFYWAHDPELGMGQWPQKAVGYMLQQNRQLLQYNFIMPIVDQIAGGLVKIPYDPEIYPTNAKVTTLTKSIKKAMYSDKELMDWPAIYNQLVRAGLIHEAVIKQVVSKEYDRDLGNIGWDMTLPGSVMASPLWKSPCSKHCEMCFHESWYTPENLMRVYPEPADLLKYQIAQDARNGGETYGTYGGITPFYQEDGTWGNAHRLIQQYRMADVVINRDYVVTENGDIPIPDDVPEDNRYEWLNQYIPTWQPELVYSRPEPEKICYVRAICPTLTKFELLESKPTEIQIGRLPFYWWSASRANGESHSIVDAVKDIQTNINYWESLITHKLQVDGGGGAQFVERSKFASDAEYNRYKTERNNPAAMFEVKSGALSDGGVVALPVLKAAFPQEAYEHLNHLIGVILPHISKVTPSSKGLTEGPVQSGKLYDMLRVQSDALLATVHESLRIFHNEIYEGYLMQAASTYSQELIPRTFTFNGGRESITLNEPYEEEVVDQETGQRYIKHGIKNDVRMLRQIRHKIIVSETQASPTDKLQQIDAISRLVASLGDKAKPATVQYLTNKAAELFDQLDEEDREVLAVLGEKELELAIVTIESQIAQQKLLTAQAMSQLNPPQPPMPPTENANALPRNANTIANPPQLEPPQAAPAGAPIPEQPQAAVQGVPQ
jgi:hypothetical protein